MCIELLTINLKKNYAPVWCVAVYYEIGYLIRRNYYFSLFFCFLANDLRQLAEMDTALEVRVNVNRGFSRVFVFRVFGNDHYGTVYSGSGMQ